MSYTVTFGLPSGIRIMGFAMPSMVTVAFSGIGIELIMNLVRLTPDPLKANLNWQPLSVIHELSVVVPM
jgi:hypothetical protein